MFDTGHFLKIIMMLFFLIPQLVYPQEDKGALVLEVKVEEDYEPLGNSRIIVYKDARQIETLKTNKRGQSTVELDLNDAYTLKFSKESYVSKNIEVNTSLPDDEKGVWRIGFTIGLFRMYPGLDVSALQDPVTKIVFKENRRDFGYDAPYTRKMMDRVDKILAQLRELREKAYKRIISKGDRHFNNHEYKQSIQYYQMAIRQRPRDEYPQKRLRVAQQKLKEYAETQRLYRNAIERADTLFGQEDYEKAREVYYEGIGYDDSKTYPFEQLGKIDSLLILAEQKKLSDKEQRARYRRYLELADKQFEEGHFMPAKIAYRNALGFFPEEQYPRQQIETIKGILAEKRQREKNRDFYKKLIEAADECFENKLFYDARTLYSEALLFLSEKEYPRIQIEKIDRIFEKRADIREKYNAAMKKGDDYFYKGMYWLARNAYQEALAFKPGEDHPLRRINMTNGILQSKYRQQRYRTLLAEADRAFKKEDYIAAKQKYQDALNVKPDADYPGERVGEINEELARRRHIKQKEQRSSVNVEAVVDGNIPREHIIENMLAYRKTLLVSSEGGYAGNEGDNDDSVVFADYTPYLKEQPHEDPLGKQGYDLTRQGSDHSGEEHVVSEQIGGDPVEEAENDLNMQETANHTDVLNQEGKVEQIPPKMEFESNRERADYLKEVTEKYPEGITVEYYTLKTLKIKRVVVNYDGQATDFRRIQHDWGGTFYFRDGQAISKQVFRVETRERNK